MKKIINIYKPLGLTPLQLIEKFRSKFPEYKKAKIGFAGRLDPMAHGVMLLMIGDETKNRDKYLGLDKEYMFEVLFGVSTDTHDALGILNHLTIKLSDNYFNNKTMLQNRIEMFIKTKIGKHSQSYPPYSSIEVSGKPLFQWARENKLSEIEIPKKEIEIYEFELLEIGESKPEDIRKRIFENIKKVEGDFRQDEIAESWNKFFSNNLTIQQPALPAGRFNHLVVAKFRVNCSSGTYVRSLASELGKDLQTGAIALDINRTRVGGFALDKSINLDG